MEHCALCDGVSRESLISFHHVRDRQRVTLEIPLCVSCANKMEKHLKRAIPKRLMAFDPVEAVPLAA